MEQSSIDYSLFLELKYELDLNDIKVLDIDVFNIDNSDIKVIKALIDIEKVMFDLHLSTNWFKIRLNNAPFLGRTPKELINIEGRSGVFAIKLYLISLRQYAKTLIAR